MTDSGKAGLVKRRFAGRPFAIGFVVFLAVAVAAASWIHRTNLIARDHARRDAEAAEGASR